MFVYLWVHAFVYVCDGWGGGGDEERSIGFSKRLKSKELLLWYKEKKEIFSGAILWFSGWANFESP